MRLTKAKQWSLRKLRHSVVVLHQLTFIESRAVFQANCCVSPPHPSRQTVRHHKLTFDNDLYTLVCQCDYARCMPRCLHCRENISVSLKFGGGEKSFANAASHKCSTSHSQIHMPYNSGNCIGSPKTNVFPYLTAVTLHGGFAGILNIELFKRDKGKTKRIYTRITRRTLTSFQHWP